MTAFYKQKTKGFIDELKAFATKEKMVESLTAFVKEECPGLIEHILSERAATEFIDLLLILIMSHRFEK